VSGPGAVRVRSAVRLAHQCAAREVYEGEGAGLQTRSHRHHAGDPASAGNFGPVRGTAAAVHDQAGPSLPRLRPDGSSSLLERFYRLGLSRRLADDRRELR
jgi:hypothetical protein